MTPMKGDGPVAIATPASCGWRGSSKRTAGTPVEYVDPELDEILSPDTGGN